MTTLGDLPAATAATASAAAPTVSRSRVFWDAVAAEWMKMRTIRSTWAFLAGGVAATLVGMLILFLLIQSFDQDAAAAQANYETADTTVVVMPFVMFFLGSIGAMVITSEFTTGSIGPGLLAVPRRRVLLGAKATVAAAVGVLGGLLFALVSFAGATLLLGDRPAPLNPWPNWADGLLTVFCGALVVLVTNAVALGLGAVFRSTASTLVTMGGLVLVAPVFAHFLPTTWQLRFGSILLPNLTPQLAGDNHPYLLSQAGATAVLVGYVVVALGAGALSFCRRDAS
ncbi:ABC transporter permease [Actinopolymorpha pittospori]|uniref:ABC-type transport system involved in multi-copper enzyme maturation permease subunit n=1 Tax=Actinopolymorpha pittospori TaxID=648752 RepID=A0A927MS50_9ACTN|nr:ABC transporter permease [Actinopolymorpha pittospori]MBE1605885.1 ABC-type transport system involved in multi-copper enzyme maturation permease subunit [Actinopolymorpha pittospori]